MLLKCMKFEIGQGFIRLEMNIWIVIFLSLLVYLKNADGVNARSEGKLKFRPLPKGKSYSLSKEEAKLEWNLRGLSDIADGIALALRKDPPYDIIGNVLSQSFGTGGKSPSISEVVDYEVPLIALAAFSLLAAIVIPIVGLIFCCCRCKGNCGGNVDDSELKLHPTKERIGYSVGILFCALFLGLAGSFLLSSSVKMSDSLPHARTVWEDSFGDIETYTNNTLKELNYLVIQEAIPMVNVLLENVFAMGRAIVIPVLAKGQPVFEELFQAVLDGQKAISQSLVLLNEIHYTVASLVSKGNSIQFDLHTARENLTTAKDDCQRDSGGSAACNKIPEGDKLSTEANFTKVPNVNETHKKVEDVAKTNLTHEVMKGNESIHDIPHRVHNLTTNLRKDFKNYSSKIENTTVDVLRPLEDNINKYIKDALDPVRDDVNEKYLGPDGMVTKYDNYRHVIFTWLGVLILLDAFLLLIAVILGLVGSARHDTPSSRSNLSDWGGRLMIGAAGLFFFSAFFVNLLTGILFLAGSNIAIVCDDLPDYKLLKKTIDDPKVMGKYILAQELLGDGSVPVTASGVLSGCSKNHAPWDVLKMDNVYNLSDALDYKDKIPSINEVFEKLNETIEDTTVLSSDAQTSVNDSLDAGVHEINFTQYHEQVNKPIVTVPLAPFASNVSKAADAVKSVSQKASDQLKATSDRLEHVHNTAVSRAEQQANELGRLVNELQVQGNAIKSSYSRVMKSLEDAKTFLSDDAPAIAAKAAVENWDRVFGDVDFFIALVVRQVRVEIGRCKPLSNIYRGLTSSVCYHYAAGMNVSWVALGLCALFLLISIILCVRASKHFRRVSGRERIDDSVPDEDGVKLKRMQRVPDREALL